MAALPPRVKRTRPHTAAGAEPAEAALRYVVVGGGIAGVSCAKEISRLVLGAGTNATVVLVSACELLKDSASVVKLTNLLEEIQVFEKHADVFAYDNPSIRVVQQRVVGVDACAKLVHLASGKALGYDCLCLCCGAVPRPLASHALVLTLRDLHSVEELARRLRGARRVAVVGNGGIALELVHALLAAGCGVAWAVRDAHAGAVFVDAAASRLLLQLRGRSAGRGDGGGGGKGGGGGGGGRKGEGMDVAVGDDHDPDTAGAQAAAAAEEATSSTPAPTAPTAAAAGPALGPEWVSRSDFWARVQGPAQTGPGAAAATSGDWAWPGDGAGGGDGSEAEAGAGGVPGLRLLTGQDISGLCDGGTGFAGAAAAWSPVPSTVFAPPPALALPPAAAFSAAPHEPEAFPLLLLTSAGLGLACDFAVSATGVDPSLPFPVAFGPVPLPLPLSLPAPLPLPVPVSAAVSASASASVPVPVPVPVPEPAVQSQTQTQTKTLAQAQTLALDGEGAVIVDGRMRTSLAGVFAAGDCCSYQPRARRRLGQTGLLGAGLGAWPEDATKDEDEDEDEDEDKQGGGEDKEDRNPVGGANANQPSPGQEQSAAPLPAPQRWHQMKLWSQARSMGTYAAQSACAQPGGPLSRGGLEQQYGGGLGLRLFAHVTRFFGLKVVLLGCFAGQGLGAAVAREVVGWDPLGPAALGSSSGSSSGSTSSSSSSSSSSVPGAVPVPGAGSELRVVQDPEGGSAVLCGLRCSTRADLCLWARVAPAPAHLAPPPGPHQAQEGDKGEAKGTQEREGQGDGEDEDEGEEQQAPPSYVKLLVLGGRVVGALLLGDTGLEEVCENLLLNGTDVSGFGLGLLDPRVDLEGYWD